MIAACLEGSDNDHKLDEDVGIGGEKQGRVTESRTVLPSVRADAFAPLL